MNALNKTTFLWFALAALAATWSAAEAQSERAAQRTRPVGASQQKAGVSLEQHILVRPSELKWKPGPQSLPAGITAALIEGDPSIPDRLFTMQFRLPANTRIAPHFHGTDEHVTVLSGEFRVGMGDTFDEAQLTSVPAGGFVAMPAGHTHFASVTRDTTIQLHGLGPWTITYVNPKDDPRRQGVGGSERQQQQQPQ